MRKGLGPSWEWGDISVWSRQTQMGMLRLMHFSICAEKIKHREKKTSRKILCRSLSVGNCHLMSPDSSKRRWEGGESCLLMFGL